MTNELSYIAALLHKHLQQSLTVTERKQLVDWINQSDRNRALWERINDAPSMVSETALLYTYNTDRIRQKIAATIAPMDAAALPALPRPAHRIHFLQTNWFRYVAILLLIAGTALYLYHANTSQPKIALQPRKEQSTDILPGGNKALLTLADGSRIVLDSAANIHLAQQGNTKIVKLDAGALAYQPLGSAQPGEVLYNTISTPKGGQYQVVLPDGSRVWLNAASSIRFPTVFVKERTVRITGEAYVEVASDKTKPFRVGAGKMEVQVLGTSFNINAYEDEAAMQTTLLTGSVRIVSFAGNNAPSDHPEIVTLKRGQQLEVSLGQKCHVKQADTQQVLAWKNGLFNFSHADLPTIMRQLERWYDIKVIYEGDVPSFDFEGGMQRNLSLQEVLRLLGKMKVHFHLDGRVLTIRS